jgi:hypothetical protein
MPLKPGLERVSQLKSRAMLSGRVTREKGGDLPKKRVVLFDVGPEIGEVVALTPGLFPGRADEIMEK